MRGKSIEELMGLAADSLLELRQDDPKVSRSLEAIQTLTGLMRAVAREEIERANLNQGDTDGSGTGDVRRRAEGRGVLARGGDPRGPSGGTGDREMAALSDNRPTVAPVSGEPGGVRVVWDDHGGPPRVEVDVQTLVTALSAAIGDGWLTTEAVEAFATRLGLTLSDGGTDD